MGQKYLQFEEHSWTSMTSEQAVKLTSDTWTDGQTDKTQTDRHTDKLMDTQTDRQTDR